MKRSVVALLLLGAGVAHGQKPVSVTGVAYDSIRHAPLEGASITLSGTTRTALTDVHGFFRLDSVVPGKYTIVMMHDLLDSIGLSGVGSRVEVSDGRDTVRLAIPSYRALWMAACHTPTPPADSGFVFGTVHDAAGQPTAGAAITASWLDIGYDKEKGATSHAWHLEITSDADGNFTLCGVPSTTGLRVGARKDSTASSYVDLLPGTLRIWRQDLTLAAPAEASATGNVAGVVTGENGRLLRDARVSTEGVTDARTGPDGRFVLRLVPAGTRQIEVRAIGLQPVTVPVTVIANDLVSITVDLSKVVALDTVEVQASAVRARQWADVLERQKTGLGYYRDSTAIAKLPTVESVFRQVNDVTVKRANGKTSYYLPGDNSSQCLANVFIDRIKSDQAEVGFLYPDQVALIEVYPRMLTTPADFVVRTPGDKSGSCGTILIWTKRVVPSPI